MGPSAGALWATCRVGMLWCPVTVTRALAPGAGLTPSCLSLLVTPSVGQAQRALGCPGCPPAALLAQVPLVGPSRLVLGHHLSTRSAFQPWLIKPTHGKQQLPSLFHKTADEDGPPSGGAAKPFLRTGGLRDRLECLPAGRALTLCHPQLPGDIRVQGHIAEHGWKSGRRGSETGSFVCPVSPGAPAPPSPALPPSGRWCGLAGLLPARAGCPHEARRRGCRPTGRCRERLHVSKSALASVPGGAGVT